MATALLPTVRTQCTLHRDDSHGDGLPHLDPQFEIVAQIGKMTLEANLSLNLYPGGKPLMYIYACDRDGEGRSDGGTALEEVPADVDSLNALITVITAMRDAVVRETPAMLKQMKEFDAYVSRFKEPPSVPAKKGKRTA